MVTGLVRRDSSFVAIMTSLLSFGATFQNEHDMSFVTAQTVHIVDYMLACDFLTGNSRQTYYGYIRVRVFFLYRCTILDMIELIDGSETENRTLGNPNLDEAALFTSWTEKTPLLASCRQ